jgi:E3 ubiquitin-protein ligase SHPRH
VVFYHHSRSPSWRPNGKTIDRRLRAEAPRPGLINILQIMHLGRPSTSWANFMIPIPAEDLSPDAWRIIRLAGSTSYDASPGAIWTRVDVVIEKRQQTITMAFDFHLFWNETPSPLNGLRQLGARDHTQTVIDIYYPPPSRQEPTLSPLDFYEAAYVPPSDGPSSITIEIPGLDSRLFPYQKRTLDWLLSREGVQWSTDSHIVPLAIPAPAPLSDSSRSVKDLDGNDIFLSDTFHTITSSNTSFQQIEQAARGGILSEEMGLGKTIEILALIILHPRPPVTPSSDLDGGLLRSGATLIVTPEPLRQQWMSEISRHAPGLRFTFYQGCKKEGGEGNETAKKLSEYDVVITTYFVLSAELHFTTKPSERPRRHELKYERPNSPLTQVSWWRLCLDEAQMVENSMTHASKLCCLIPRENSWAITGTPVKDDVQDLLGLLIFMGYEPLSSAPHLWRVVLNDKPTFQKLFNTLALRHTKAMVRGEIALPPQHRFVISVPFTAVEEQHYQTLYREMAEECGVDTNGNPAVEDWRPEVYEDQMRTWLNRLRQTALHPEIGVYGRRRFGRGEAGPMRTVEEVLEVMLAQSVNTLRTDERALVSSKMARGQLLENSPRVKEAQRIWEGARKETKMMVERSRAELREAIAEAKGKGPASQRQSRAGSTLSGSGDEDEEGEGEHKIHILECRRRLRYDLEIWHKAVFFCANAFFQIRENPELTEPDSEEFNALKKLEDDTYEKAKAIRREILAESHNRATRHMGKISRKAVDQTFAEISELALQTDRGIQSSRILDELDVLYGMLNDQAETLDEWREAVIQLLLKPLLDEEDDVETTGEELMDSAKIQDELMVYVQAIRAMTADRQDAMSGQTNELIKYETQTSLRMAREDQGPAPQKMLSLMEIRDRKKPHADISMRAAISEFRSLIFRLSTEEHKTQRTEAERVIAARHLGATQAALGEQNKIVLALETEIEQFTSTMNARLNYYRHLQSVSDSVLPYEGAKTEEALARFVTTEEGLQRKIAAGKAKHRYLMHLKEAGSKSQEPRMCVICQTNFEIGVLTVCGHQFCKDCMKIWYRAHHNCPVCKRHLTASDLHDITLRPQELRLHSGESNRPQQQEGDESPVQEESPLQKQTGIYSAFNVDKLAEIKDIELEGPSYTSKVDTLVRHLLWLRESDPGAKSIVFSQ